VSTLWTPGGEHEPSPQPVEGQPSGEQPGAAGEVTEEQAREQFRQLREELAATPVADIVANHAIGLWELAVLHLSPQEGAAADLEQAQLAIDAMGALVEELGDRLGRHEESLREALSQLRLAYVEMSRREEGGAGDGSG
jgi:hypothetical protein